MANSRFHKVHKMILITAATALSLTATGPLKTTHPSYCGEKWSKSSTWLSNLPAKEQAVIVLSVKGEVNEIIREETNGALTGYTQMYYNLMLSSVTTKNPTLAKMLSESADNASMVLSGSINRTEFIDMSKSLSYRMRSFFYSMNLTEAKRIADTHQEQSLQASASLLCFSKELAQDKIKSIGK